MDTGQGPHYIECDQGRGERLCKMYEGVQHRLDTDEEYRENINKGIWNQIDLKNVHYHEITDECFNKFVKEWKEYFNYVKRR